MLRFVVVTWGLAAGWGWLLFGRHGGSVAIGAALILGLSTTVLLVFMGRRADRLAGRYDHVNPRLVYRQGFSKGRWRRGQPSGDADGGSEFTLGSGW